MLRIIEITSESAANDYKIPKIQKFIDDTCVKVLKRILMNPNSLITINGQKSPLQEHRFPSKQKMSTLLLIEIVLSKSTKDHPRRGSLPLYNKANIKIV